MAILDHTARHAAIGVSVKALDRHNIATFVDIDDAAGTVLVVVSKDGAIAERDLPWQHVAILDRDIEPRHLTPAAADTLQRTRTELEDKLTAWTDTVIALGSDRDEVTILQRAADRAVAIGVGELAGDQPDWLHHLIGPRPTDTMGATTWDAIVGDVVAWQQRHPTTGSDGLGPAPAEPTDARQWQDLTTRCASARTWLTTTARPEAVWPVVRSHRELARRHRELDAILDIAPDDTRHVINAARSGSSPSPTSTRSSATPTAPPAPPASAGSSSTGPTSSSTPRSAGHCGTRRGAPTPTWRSSVSTTGPSVTTS